MSAAFAAGLGLLCVAAVLGVITGLPRPRLSPRVSYVTGEATATAGLTVPTAPYLLAAAGSACLAVAGAGAVAGRTVRLGLDQFGPGHGGLAALSA